MRNDAASGAEFAALQRVTRLETSGGVLVVVGVSRAQARAGSPSKAPTAALVIRRGKMPYLMHISSCPDFAMSLVKTSSEGLKCILNTSILMFMVHMSTLWALLHVQSTEFLPLGQVFTKMFRVPVCLCCHIGVTTTGNLGCLALLEKSAVLMPFYSFFFVLPRSKA